MLVVDDDPAILRAVRTNLSRHGFQVETASTGQAAVEHAHQHPDLIVLDLGLPDIDGLDVIRDIREHSNMPIIVLSARDAEQQKVAALDLGADDYLTKPFGIDELLARVRVALRHAARPIGGTAAIFRSGDLAIDLEHRRVHVGDQEIRLTPTEYSLLTVLARNADRVMTDAMLLQQVWGPEYGEEDHYLHVYVARLRRKIEGDQQHPRRLITEPGVGYRLLGDEDDPRY